MGKGRMVVMLPGPLLNKCSRRLVSWYSQAALWTWDSSEYRHLSCSFEEERLVVTVDGMQRSMGEGRGVWEDKGGKVLQRDKTN